VRSGRKAVVGCFGGGEALKAVVGCIGVGEARLVVLLLLRRCDCGLRGGGGLVRSPRRVVTGGVVR